MAGEIVAQGVFKSFPGRRGTLPVIDGADLRLSHGEIVALVGPSGYRKATLLDVLAGFERADRGTVHIDGERVDGPGRTRVPMRRARRSSRMSVHLELVGLADFADAHTQELSGEMRQRPDSASLLCGTLPFLCVALVFLDRNPYERRQM